MQIAVMLDNFIGYFSEAATVIFGPDRNHYPTTGIQPFEGDTTKKSRKKYRV